MKRLVLFLLSLSVLLACDGLGQQGTEAVIALDSDQQTELTLSHEANEFVVSFTSSLDWTCDIEYSDDSYEWASVNKSSGTGGYAIAKVKVSVQPNDKGYERSAKLIITSSSTSVEIRFTQESSENMGLQPVSMHMLTDGGADIDASGGLLGVVVKDGIDYQCSVEVDWILMVDYLDGGDKTYVFEVAENKSSESRSTAISFCANDTCKPFVVTQAPATIDDKPKDPEDSGDQGNPEDPGDQEMPGDDSWMKAEFKHRSLAMRFTADWCGYCPMMAQAMSNAQDQLQGNLEVLSVHCSDSGLASEASGQLTNHYSVFSYPTGLIDCRTFVENSSDIQFTTSRILEAVNYTEENYEVVTSASWTSSLSDTKVSLKLSVYVKTAGTYKVTALLVEDNYIGYQADYNSGGLNDYVHNGIIRAALSDAVGQSFTTSDAQVKTFNYTAVLPSNCIADNVRVLVYIQKLDNTTSSYYVDNTATERLGKTKTLDVVSGAWSDDNEGIVPGDDITL